MILFRSGTYVHSYGFENRKIGVIDLGLYCINQEDAIEIRYYGVSE